MSVLINHRKVPDSGTSLHENPLVHRILCTRGITDSSQLLCAATDLPRPEAIPGIADAIECLLQARESDTRIVIVGDYDCDGATSTCVAMLGLRMLGFKHLNYLIPSRFRYGYGLSEPIVDLAIDQHAAQLIVTVDNGVASFNGVAHANQRGVKVLVTDHHLPPEQLPQAVAIVNPNLPESEFASSHLAGVGVIFYVLLALRARLSLGDDPYANAPLAQLLDLVAIGTVADLVKLDEVNRILVEQGLRRIRAGSSRPGVKALIQVSGLNADQLSTESIGFGLGPRLNAAGRLDDMSVGVRCLMSDEDQTAGLLAEQLNALNQKRRSIESSMQLAADRQLAELSLTPEALGDHYGLCLKDPEWHEGVIGILAGRIKEKLHLPVVVFTQADETHLKGSARSVAGVHIRDVLQVIATEFPQSIEKFGGHAMAAGLTLKSDAYDTFCDAFDQTVKKALDGRRRHREFLTDGHLSEDELSLPNAQLLSRLLPWGPGFEAPLFDNWFVVRRLQVLSGRHLKLVLALADAPLSREASNQLTASKGNRAVSQRVLDYASQANVPDAVDTSTEINPRVADSEHTQNLPLAAKDQSIGHSQLCIDAIAFNCQADISVGQRIRVVYVLSVNHWRGRDALQLRILHLQS
ncbi:MAG: single-stranded-DNA-specific exonuclease RecJ [Granulosicoccus sp.]|nr:single-stranded-DNA-specific exonuclease RecJ [Granulosicoccus sp.]